MSDLSRRSFIKRCLASSVGMSSLTASIAQLGMMKSVLAQNSHRFADYKALVCIFLHGGNDSFNMLVPSQTTDYAKYQAIRQSLAYLQDSLLPITPTTTQAYQLGMPPALTEVASLFNQGKLAMLANVGPLLYPLTKTEALSQSDKLPPQLFSHNDQQKHWQTSWPEQNPASGWAGRMADLLMDTNTSLSMNFSLEGSNIWQTGTQSLPYVMEAEGVEQLALLNPEQAWNANRITAFDSILSQANTSNNILERSFAGVINRTRSNMSILESALAAAPSSTTSYPTNNPLGEQLAMVAKLASIQANLGQSRQLFFVSLGGFDTHDQQITRHPALLQQLSQAIAAFDANLVELGLSNNVTAFTMSDFGRTLTSNGDGTDHGWGGHQMIFGGAVQGGDIYGTLPTDIALNSNDDVGEGRMLPTTSVDQYAATLARWFGLTENEIQAVFPNLSRFASSNLGFI